MSNSVGPLPAGRSRAEMVTEVAANLDSVREDAAVLVACSGGPDSSALAHLVAEARPDLALVFVHVAHGLRGRAADQADRDVVAIHAGWLGAELVGCDIEVASSGRGIEAAARDARYEALREVASNRGAVAIVVGHSADDQAETVLLRLARGTGTDGLGAMATVAGDLIRPLLRLRRGDLHAFVAGEGLPVTLDETNEDDAIRRVRVRREVLPAMQRIGPDPVATLGRLAALSRDDAMALAAADAAVPDAFRRIGPVVALRSEALRSVPVAIARRVVRRALSELVDVAPSAATVTRILDAPVGDAATLPGGVAFRAERAWRTLVVTVSDIGGEDGDRGGRTSQPRVEVTSGEASFALAAPGRLVWAPAGLVLRVLVPASDGSTLGPGDGPDGGRGDAFVDDEVPGEQIALPLPGVWAPPRHHVPAGRTAPGTDGARYDVTLPGEGGGLTVRTMVPGDRIRGPGGTRRVTDVLRDAGMPRAIRARWPVVVEAGGSAREGNGGSAREGNGGSAREGNGGSAREGNGGSAREGNGGSAREENGGSAREENGGSAREEAGGSGRVVWIPGVAVDAERLAAGRREPALVIQAGPS